MTVASLASIFEAAAPGLKYVSHSVSGKRLRIVFDRDGVRLLIQIGKKSGWNINADDVQKAARMAMKVSAIAVETDPQKVPHVGK